MASQSLTITNIKANSCWLLKCPSKIREQIYLANFSYSAIFQLLTRGSIQEHNNAATVCICGKGWQDPTHAAELDYGGDEGRWDREHLS
jgi:hypothetical protein